MKRVYLKHEDQVFATGVFLTWDGENKKWIVDRFEDSTFYDGHYVADEESKRPYVEIESDKKAEVKNG